MIIAGLFGILHNVYAEETNPVDEEVFISLTREVQLKEDLPTNVTTINNEEIQKTGARNVGEILDFSTDINVGKYGTLGSINSIILRGALDKQVLLLIDGRPVNDITLGGYDYSKLSVENIERIEIIRGAASSIYGANALAGVINVITKEICFEKPIADVNVSYGEYGEQIYRLNVAKKIGNLETNFSGSKILSQGFRKNSAYGNDNLDIYAGLRSDNAGMFKLKSGITRYELGLPGKNNTPLEDWNNNIETTAAYPLTKKTGNESYLTLSHEKDLTDKIKLTSRLYGSLDSGRYMSPENWSNDLTEKITTGLEIQGNMPYGLTIGGELRQDTAKRTNEFDTPVIIDFDKKVDWTSIYLQENYSPRDNLNTIIGLRYDQHSYFGGELNPQLTVVWKPQEDWKLSSNIGKSYRAPSFEDLFSPYSSWTAIPGFCEAGDSQGNPDVKPEMSLSYDIGFEKNWKDNISSQLTIFRQDIDNLIEWNNISDIETWEEWRPSNVLDAYNQGIELELKHSINENLFYSFNCTYLESKGKAKTENNYTTLMYRPSNSANLILSYMTPWKTRVILTGKYVGEQYDDSDNFISPYSLLNTRFEQTFFNYTKIFISVDNVTDTRYFTRAGYPLPGRVIRGGVNVTF
jgi:outer membrane cobalamin receptor